MATQSIAGFNAKVLISGDGGVTFNPFAEITDITLDLALKTQNATSHDSGGWEENIPGNASWKATGKALYVFADAQRTAVRNALINKTLLQFQFQPKFNTVGQEKFTGSGYIVKYANTLPNEAPAGTDIEIVGTGALIAGVQ